MSYSPTIPTTFDICIFEDISLQEISAYIDWSPFFLSWELKGKYPAILHDEIYGKEAQQLFDDAQQLLSQLIESKRLKANAVCRIFPVNSINDDDIEIYTDNSRTSVLTKLHFLRQQNQKASNQPNFCLADFIAPKQSNINDYMGAFVVSAGHHCDEICKEYELANDDYSSILVKAIADRLAEASAEWLHDKVRKELWGYEKIQLDNQQLIEEFYQGIRPAPGYPACPDHTEKSTLFSLVQATEHTGITLTESYAMMPAASVSGWYFAHPAAKYFTIGKISKEQVISYAERKNMSVEECEKWLGPVLAYS